MKLNKRIVATPPPPYMETETSKPSNTSCDSTTKRKKRRKKKKKRDTTSLTPSESTVKERSLCAPLPAVPPPTSRGRRCAPLPQLADKKDAEQASGSEAGRRRRKVYKSPPPVNRISRSGASLARHRGQESLRWEGALEDPQAEERRLELYKANRRQRYIAHRESLQKENQEKPKQRERRP